MKRALLIATIASGAVFLFASRAPSPHAAISPPPTRVGANAVWTPSPGVLSDIRQVCSAGDPDQQKACFLDSMKSAGASDEAAAFVKSFAANGLAYVRAFRDTGRVDIAYIEYLFRANEMRWRPPRQRHAADDRRRRLQIHLAGKFDENADYVALLTRKYPAATVFGPTTATTRSSPYVTSSTNRARNSEVDYLLSRRLPCVRAHRHPRLKLLLLRFFRALSGDAPCKM